MRTTPTDPVLVGIGSNISPDRHIGAALSALDDMGLLRAASTVYRSPAIGLADDAADFLNLVVRLEWEGDLRGLKARLGRIETRLGRPAAASPTWVSRTIDLDVLVAGDLVGAYAERSSPVPHPDIERFAHVAVPLAELAGDRTHPVSGRSYAEIAASLDSSGLRPVGTAWTYRVGA
ncbi:2-amino-4-hydroxy-6-hydroxymethyldihydropteridine diphosphokinase [Spinactinospora alkalitolerans]|uniref:2-amino-4-hydroxy-6-hydroxymethyldihydropteridine diphosphokinase n=1 Tax=Spinactinospora alkalitolerans TaxID=687207 RepID=A0A852U5E3_9ACTN|nr:2-amino-4-hydroxy-6-hydroxymethyldihydropteridine diphosphokinase [Spinactinospora alkalitolerans]NYE50722.1 2-amino-4-hydroxy-6-hydroxymethyldihydropteridine diphosphokinase [Spinactinospora alkalitolerans]